MENIFNFEEQYFSYYRMYERDFFNVEEYIAVNPDNYSSYSVYYGKLLINICSEIDSLMKIVCKKIDPTKNPRNIMDYCKIIQSNFPNFNNEMVGIYNKNIDLMPWYKWEIEIKDNKACCIKPNWWDAYNLIKHHRTEKNKNSKKENYKLANQINVLNSLAALYILEQYTIYSFCKDNLEDKMQTHVFLNCKSKRMQIHFWIGCYKYFAGYETFDIKYLKKIMDKRDVSENQIK